LLPDSEGLDASDAFHRELVTYFPAARALRLRHFRDAWTLANTPGEGMRYPRLAVRRQLIAAAAAHELEQFRDARRLIEATIPVAERLGSAVLLRDAYSIAAKVTGEARFRRQANEVARLLTA
jgi:hypothetical protein